jgi:hypothetical protein
MLLLNMSGHVTARMLLAAMLACLQCSRASMLAWSTVGRDFGPAPPATVGLGRLSRRGKPGGEILADALLAHSQRLGDPRHRPVALSGAEVV